MLSKISNSLVAAHCQNKTHGPFIPVLRRGRCRRVETPAPIFHKCGNLPGARKSAVKRSGWVVFLSALWRSDLVISAKGITGEIVR